MWNNPGCYGRACVYSVLLLVRHIINSQHGTLRWVNPVNGYWQSSGFKPVWGSSASVHFPCDWDSQQPQLLLPGHLDVISVFSSSLQMSSHYMSVKEAMGITAAVGARPINQPSLNYSLVLQNTIWNIFSSCWSENRIVFAWEICPVTLKSSLTSSLWLTLLTWGGFRASPGLFWKYYFYFTFCFWDTTSPFSPDCCTHIWGGGGGFGTD